MPSLLYKILQEVNQFPKYQEIHKGEKIGICVSIVYYIFVILLTIGIVVYTAAQTELKEHIVTNPTLKEYQDITDQHPSCPCRGELVLAGDVCDINYELDGLCT